MNRRLATAVFMGVFLFESAPLLNAAATRTDYLTVMFDRPADAVSARMISRDEPILFSYETFSGWTVWQTLGVDQEDPESLETDLRMFPVPVKEIRIKGVKQASDVHPITVSRDPVKPRTASLNNSGNPAILSRKEWGADDSYLFETKSESSSSEADIAKGDLGIAQSQPNQRIIDCQNAQQKYPDEFAVKSTVKKDEKGRVYIWPLQYSREIKLLVVHHTGLLVRGDPRTAVERVRALYKYHALSKGWGDIGYNYVIDENGQIYEGRTGGKGVVAGHAYCNNVGTVGVVLMGNFEVEQPTQTQIKSLQGLLRDLAGQYGLDLKKSVQFHGKKLDAPIVRHRDLLSTLCPGYYVTGAFSQIVANVRSGEIDTPVTLPIGSGISSSSSSGVAYSSGIAEGISFIGRTAIAINPGGKQRLSFTYTAGFEGAYEGKKIALINLSGPDLKLWVDDGGDLIPVTKGILLPYDLPAYESQTFQLLFQSPINPGNYWMDIAGLHFTVSVSGRRARTGDYYNPFHGNESLVVKPAAKSMKSTGLKLNSSVRRERMALSSSSSSKSSSAASQATAVSSSLSGKQIRIRLTATASPGITFSEAGTINGMHVTAGTRIQLLNKESACEALVGGEKKAQSGILRFKTDSSGILTVDSVRNQVRNYQGLLECRIINGNLTLIDELPLEEYMAGLAEEPDSEPYEKQRAFAIAARTYAAFYLQDAQRKFPGMPYDGSDDPSSFQSFGGVDFAAANPRWLQAVNSTTGQVLMVDSTLIKPPYFSSDSGWTRNPIEAGWSNFPFASVFSAKDDHWCTGLSLRGHGVGMSGCGAKGQALEGRSAEQILLYYYPGTRIIELP